MVIGIFGGSFNPIHYGHLIVAREVQYRCGIDDFIFMPAGEPPHKKVTQLIPADHRFTMVKLAIEQFPFFNVSDYEIDKDSVSYSVDTVRYYRERFSDQMLYFIMGLDTYMELDTWKEYTRLLDYCHIIVTTRAAVDWPENIDSHPLKLDRHPQVVEIHGTLSRTNEIHGSVFFLQIPDIAISASDIRYRLRKSQPIDHFCPNKVNTYIQQHNLYRERE